MRVIAGKAKGYRLKSPRGSNVRPTSDLVREAIFSMLESVATDWSRVLDLYSGTGALGIEALSRGAGWADFVEKEPKLCSLIKENLGTTGFADQGVVYCISVAKAFSVLHGEYGILLMDPPYTDSSITITAEKLTSSHLVGKDSTVVIEHSRRMPLKKEYGDFCQVRGLHHGDSCVSVYQHAEGLS
ncbi:MAG: RsmD family RNA methyltransferase [Chloroflexota bacterium]|nr:RsmD family RNA methyltransferase [Chloroflexota bacterium]